MFLKKSKEGNLAASFYKYDSETDSFKSCSIQDIEQNDIFIRIDVSQENSFLWVALNKPYINKDKIWTVECDTLKNIEEKEK
jgi:hypothetical protein